MIIYDMLTIAECKKYIAIAKQQMNATRQSVKFSDKDKAALLESYKRQINRLEQQKATLLPN
mgnify:CR=1 FL=1